MTSANADSLTQILDKLMRILGAGHDNLLPGSMSLFVQLGTLQFVFWGILYMYGRSDVFYHLLRQFIFIGFWSWFLQNFSLIIGNILQGFIVGAEKFSDGAHFRAMYNPSLNPVTRNPF
jgi:type IV secretory pathway TrbL component